MQQHDEQGGSMTKDEAVRELADMMADPAHVFEVRDHTCPPGSEAECACPWTRLLAPKRDGRLAR